uniref:Domain of unknown function with conserved HDNR motif domain-containing protein n=1 Tax=Knipowitschia caucasica TaxID=637954 RepID=A0AAV2JIU3_KNICA
MTKGRQFSPNSRGGKWFAHPGSAGSEVGSRETCTSTGFMLTQVKSTVPPALRTEHYPKWKSQQQSREYPCSNHDNKYALKNSVFFCSEVRVHRKHFEDNQQKSHFSLDHDNTQPKAGEDISIFKSDYVEKQVHKTPANTRFPHNHQERSRRAAQDQAPDFMWFGRARSVPVFGEHHTAAT